jgi:hypothetical protein
LGNIVHSLKDSLEARGEYVVVANTRWFAVFLSKWRDRIEIAVEDGREGPNLVVYKTKSDAPRDHYVIPYFVIRELLVADTMTTSVVNGSQRWNLTLEKGKLHVSHGAGKVDVTEYYGAQLLLEQTDSPAELMEPTADPVEFEQRVGQLLKMRSLPRPAGRQVPSKRTADRTTYERCPGVKAWVLREAKGQCELCGQDAPFTAHDGERYLELHHVQQLANGGSDTVENAVALCSNCHRWLHHGIDRSAQQERLYAQVSRLTRGSHN